VHIKQNIVL